jgi:hypothetical protein
MHMTNKIKLLSLVVILVVVGQSCKKEKFNINQNPNQATDSTITYNVILPSALNNTARWVARDWGFLQNWLGYWARSGTYAPNFTEEQYALTTNFNANIWTDIYDNLYDYQAMQISANKAGAGFYEGIARIMKAHGFQVLVDVYNNVPYTQALRGAAATTPRYDKGIDIYKDLFRQLDTAINLIKTANESADGPNKSILTDDIMFGSRFLASTTIGQMKPRWVKFANTLKLRMLVHLMNGGVLTPGSTVSGIDIPGEIAKITATTDGFLTAGMNAEVNPGYATDKPMPFYELYVANAAGTATASSVYYKANAYATGGQGLQGYYLYNGDARVNSFYTPGAQGLKGVLYGQPPVTANASTELAGIGNGYYTTGTGVRTVLTGTSRATAPQWIMTAVESLFLQAEAQHRGFLPGSANTTMRAGITESFNMLGLSSAQATTYMNNNAGYPDVDYNAPAYLPGEAAGGLFTIISQKWFALNGFAPYEVWTDYRRVDYNASTPYFVYGRAVAYAPGPPLSVSPGLSQSITSLPKRLLYVQNEYNYNAANVGAEGTINAFNNRIFWDLR